MNGKSSKSKRQKTVAKTAVKKQVHV